MNIPDEAVGAALVASGFTVAHALTSGIDAPQVQIDHAFEMARRNARAALTAALPYIIEGVCLRVADHDLAMAEWLRSLALIDAEQP